MLGILYWRYRSMGHTASQQLSTTFFLLLDIMQFFDHYHAKRIDVAFNVRERERERERERGFLSFHTLSDCEAAKVTAGATWRYRGTGSVNIQRTWWSGEQTWGPPLHGYWSISHKWKMADAPLWRTSLFASQQPHLCNGCCCRVCGNVLNS